MSSHHSFNGSDTQSDFELISENVFTPETNAESSASPPSLPPSPRISTPTAPAAYVLPVRSAEMLKNASQLDIIDTTLHNCAGGIITFRGDVDPGMAEQLSQFLSLPASLSAGSGVASFGEGMSNSVFNGVVIKNTAGSCCTFIMPIDRDSEVIYSDYESDSSSMQTAPDTEMDEFFQVGGNDTNRGWEEILDDDDYFEILQ
ncbi:hypothetical protein BDQ12DRAFT_665446 [Crucibulum laeve]|uniref:Uncharacterized protein n=1 Tax=Crucibulum laeve TaxID=68775 RepID=A0A5C3M2N0_9AGAR|nr:hypothetical protein BDQ12DRAFT_665446 [Crucibulum laeve]